MLVRIIDRALMLPEIQPPSRLLHSFGSVRKLCLETVGNCMVQSQKWNRMEVERKDDSELNVGKKDVAREKKTT